MANNLRRVAYPDNCLLPGTTYISLRPCRSMFRCPQLLATPLSIRDKVIGPVMRRNRPAGTFSMGPSMTLTTYYLLFSGPSNPGSAF